MSSGSHEGRGTARSMALSRSGRETGFRNTSSGPPGGARLELGRFTRRHQDHGDRTLGPDVPHGVDAAHLGHLQVGDDEVGLDAAAGLDQPPPVPDHLGMVPQQGEGLAVELGDVRVVVRRDDAESVLHLLVLWGAVRVV
jgi:hypothetical protein